MQEDRPDEEVGQAIDPELQTRVVVDLRSGDEAGAEGAIPALLEHRVVAAEVVGVVGAVGHEDRDGVSRELIESGADGHAEARRVG